MLAAVTKLKSSTEKFVLKIRAFEEIQVFEQRGIFRFSDGRLTFIIILLGAGPIQLYSFCQASKLQMWLVCDVM